MQSKFKILKRVVSPTPSSSDLRPGGLPAGPALGMGRGGLSPPKRLSCPPNQNVGKDSVTHFYDLCID